MHSFQSLGYQEAPFAAPFTPPQYPCILFTHWDTRKLPLSLPLLLRSTHAFFSSTGISGTFRNLPQTIEKNCRFRIFIAETAVLYSYLKFQKSDRRSSGTASIPYLRSFPAGQPARAGGSWPESPHRNRNVRVFPYWKLFRSFPASL